MAKKGEIIVVHYRGMLKSGKVFDSSEGREPLQFMIGSGSMIPGFEKAVKGMKVGEVKTATIKAADAYGPVRKDLIKEISKDKLPTGLSPQVGDKLRLGDPKKGTTEVKVVKVTDTSVTLDANHDLAGEDIIFTIKLVAIRK
jgi:peptidylprolyl isomerase